MAITTITKVGAFTDDVATQINDNFSSLSASTAGGTLTDAHILVGNGDDEATDVAVSGDVSLANDGAMTVTGVNGAAVTGDGTDIQAALDLIAGISTVNVASPEIWNDNGTLKVGTA